MHVTCMMTSCMHVIRTFILTSGRVHVYKQWYGGHLRPPGVQYQ